MTPSEALVWVLVLFPPYVALVAYLTLKEYRTMSDRLSRALRTAVQAFLAAAVPLIAGKLAGVDGIEDLSGLVSVVVPAVSAGIGAALSAVMFVLFPPATPE
jgi:hypothetical protein